MNPPVIFLARVSAISTLTPKIREFRIELIEPKEIAFRAGQFIQLLIAPRIMRQYSIVSSPKEKNVLILCADLSPAGEGSKYLEGWKIGDELRFRGPFGVFIIPPEEQRPIELIATGAGIAPMYSLVLDRLETTTLPLQLLFGNRNEEHLFYHEDFQRLADTYPHFRYVPTLSQPSPAWQGQRGRVTEILQHREDLLGRPFYLCGSPAMVDDTRKVLAKKGVADADVHFEKFF